MNTEELQEEEKDDNFQLQFEHGTKMELSMIESHNNNSFSMS